MKNLFVFLLCSGVVSSVCAGDPPAEKPLARKFAQVHNILVQVEEGIEHGGPDTRIKGKATLWDFKTSMESEHRKNFSITSPTTAATFAPALSPNKEHVSLSTKFAFDVYGKDDLEKIDSILNN